MIQYSELAKRARDEVRDLEEPFRSIAFERILENLIQEARKTAGEAPVQDEKGASPHPSPDPVELFLTNTVDAAQYAKLFGVKGRLLEKSLAVLKLARAKFGVDGLTPPSVAEILIKKFRVARVHAKNVSRDLANAPEFVNRIRSNGEYRYLLMSTGEQHLEAFVSALK